MVTVGATLRLSAVEFWRLLARTVATIGRIWPQAIGLLLLGWSANNLAILLGTEAAARWPLAVIPIVALGAVLQLVTILALLRFAAGVLRGATTDEAGARGESSNGFARVVAMTLLTFMAMYAGFGYLSRYARDVVLLSTYRKGYGDLLGALNPLQTPSTAVAMAAIFVTGWLANRLIEPWSARTRYPLTVKFLNIAVEAVVALTGLLGLFRFFEWVHLWVSDRAFNAWRDSAWTWVTGLIHVDVPAIFLQAWMLFADVVWPVLSTGILRPLLWLAMAGLVFGGRILSLSDLWRLESAEETTRRSGMLARLRRDDDTAAGIRTIVLRLQGFLFGGLDSRVLPAWQSFRLILRSGWPFVCAYLVAFTLVDLAGQWLEHLVLRLIGGHDVSFWIKVNPFVDLVTSVAVNGFQWVLLAVAYHRALGIEEAAALARAEGAPSDHRGATGDGRPRLLEVLTAAVVSVAVVIAAGLAAPGEVEIVQHVGTRQRVELHGERVIAGDPRVARSVTRFGERVGTDRVFVVVPFGVGSPANPTGLGMDVTLRAGARTYRAFDGSSLVPSAPAGFSVIQELVFELDPADVTPAAVLRVRPSELVSGTQQQAEISLGLTADAVATAPQTTDLAQTTKAAL